MSATLRKRAAGFSLVAAIFLLTILAALGAFIVTVSTTQGLGSALDVQGARAYQAARAGIEWGVYQVQSTPAYNFGHANDPLPTDPNLRSCSTASASFAFPTAPTLAAFTVTVVCTAHPDASGGPTVYDIHATACSQPAAGACPNAAPAANYVERQMQVSF